MIAALRLPGVGRYRRAFGALAVGVACVVIQVDARASGCLGDVNDDGVVDGADLIRFVGGWGACSGCAEDLDHDGRVSGADLGVMLANWGACAPRILSVSPNVGPATGGTQFTINGCGFVGATRVFIGGAEATNVSVLSSHSITAISPPGVAGSSDVVVSAMGGLVTAAGAFSYQLANVPPWATQIEALPDPELVVNSELRAAIVASGFAWHVRDIGTGIEMMLVPAGNFAMGASPGDAFAQANEYPRHTVAITHPFYMGRFEVTQAQWVAKMGNNPSFFRPPIFPDGSNSPVEQVSWSQIQGFLAATSMRLPTEAEWEYACRAGTSSATYAAGNQLIGDIAWWQENSASFTHPVGTKAPNGFGLHDMLGNVQEWTADWYSDSYYANSPTTDPIGPFIGSTRVERGGSSFSTDACRASSRTSWYPDAFPNFTEGFRVARTP